MDNSKPWVDHPDIWKTEATFWSWLRGGLRRAVWNKHPLKLNAIKEHRTRIPGKKEGTTRYGCVCVLCGQSFPQNQIQVDHVKGNASLKSWEDVLQFVAHMAVPEDLQVVCKPCHKQKTLADSRGLTFEEAGYEKETIAVCKKSTKEVLAYIQEHKYNGPTANAKQRRTAVAEIVKKLGES